MTARRALHGSLEGLQQGIEIEGVIMAYAIDEEGRGAVHTAAHAAHDIVADALGMDVRGQLAGESEGVQTDRGRVPDQVIVLQRMLILEQVASQLGISEVTVKIHRGQVVQKMQANSAADLVRMAERVAPGPRIV